MNARQQLKKEIAIAKQIQKKKIKIKILWIKKLNWLDNFLVSPYTYANMKVRYAYRGQEKTLYLNDTYFHSPVDVINYIRSMIRVEEENKMKIENQKEMFKFKGEVDVQ